MGKITLQPGEPFFVDTSAWYASLVKDDCFHASAAQFIFSQGGSLVTSNYVIMETANLIHLRQGYPLTKEFLEMLQISHLLSFHYITPDEHSASVEMFLQNRGKVSLTDCSSFVAMRKLKIRNAFTFDQDFARQGFSCFPKT